VVDPEEAKFRAREEALRKQREARAARLRQLEEEEEEGRKAEEEYQARKKALLNAKAQPPVEIAPPAPPAPPKAPEVVIPPPQPRVQQAPPTVSPSVEKTSKNPFSRFMKDGAGTPSADSPSSAPESKNPFPIPFKAPTPPSVPTPSKSPTPSAVKTSYQTAPGDSDDEWDRIEEKDEDDSSDDEFRTSRDNRSKIAQQFFGNITNTRLRHPFLRSKFMNWLPTPRTTRWKMWI
jgi:hypothetical protein